MHGNIITFQLFYKKLVGWIVSICNSYRLHLVQRERDIKFIINNNPVFKWQFDKIYNKISLELAAADVLVHYYDKIDVRVKTNDDLFHFDIVLVEAIR